MDSRQAKDALFEATALMGKAFASPRRLDLLAQAPRTVEELARASSQSGANTSQHLQALYAAGMVNREREGTSVRYSLAGDEVLRLWLALREVAAVRLAEVERAAEEYLGEEVERIDRAELEQRLADLPEEAEIVAYCRGPFCAYAHEAVRQLRATGRRARRLREGWPEWRLAEPRSRMAAQGR